MTSYAYLFEAKSLQSYIFATNRLKEIVGASELIESLTTEKSLTNKDSLLDDVLKIAKVKNVQFSRRGGGVFYAFSHDQDAMDRFATLWSLVVRQYAPDLEFIQARGEGSTDHSAFENAQKDLLAARNVPVARFPQAPPLAIRNRRTGEPAVAWHKKKSEPVDAATNRKLDPKFWRGVALGQRFAPGVSWGRWPLNLSPEQPEDDGDESDVQNPRGPRDFPFIEDDRTFAVIHADGNGLGQLLIKLGEVIKHKPDIYIELFSAFSRAVTVATETAAQRATKDVLEKNMVDGVYPARPIVLGGDDLTILVRSDLALKFTRCFLEYFAKESRILLTEFKTKFDLDDIPEQLTACAGIAYAKASQPLHMLYELAESLCKHAKKHSKAQNPKNIPASLSFHRVTTAFIDNYAEVLERELTFDIPNQNNDKNQESEVQIKLRQTLECYALEPGKGLAKLDDLLELRDLLTGDEFSKGAARQLLGIIGRDPLQAPRHYKRWREVMIESSRSEQLNKFDMVLAKFGIQADSDLPYFEKEQPERDKPKLRLSPLGDVIMLKAVNDNKLPPTTDNKPVEAATCD